MASGGDCASGATAARQIAPARFYGQAEAVPTAAHRPATSKPLTALLRADSKSKYSLLVQ